MTPQARCIPDALLERYLTGSLTVEQKARMEAQLAASAEDQAQLARLRADSEAFLLQHPPRVVVMRFEQHRRRAGRWLWSAALLVPALAVAAAALLMLRPPEEPFTAKGDPILSVYRKEGTGVVKVERGDILVPNDSIRFKFSAAKSGFAAVLSKDAQGVITVYYPFGGEAAEPYDMRQPELPGAVHLDGTLGSEELYALYSTQPFELGWAKQALKEGRDLKEQAPPSISVVNTSFLKQATRPRK